MKKTQRAFTIVELMATIIIVAVMVATALPSFQALVANSRSNTLASEMVSALNVARSESIKRSSRVSVCSSSNGAVCDGAPWQGGWIVFTDTAPSDTAVAPTVGVVIKQWGGNAGGAVINVNKNAVALLFIRFSSQGMLARATSDTNPIEIDTYQQGCTGNAGRHLQVGIAGRISQSSITCP